MLAFASGRARCNRHFGKRKRIGMARPPLTIEAVHQAIAEFDAIPDSLWAQIIDAAEHDGDHDAGESTRRKSR